MYLKTINRKTSLYCYLRVLLICFLFEIKFLKEPQPQRSVIWYFNKTFFYVNWHVKKSSKSGFSMYLYLFWLFLFYCFEYSLFYFGWVGSGVANKLSKRGCAWATLGTTGLLRMSLNIRVYGHSIQYNAKLIFFAICRCNKNFVRVGCLYSIYPLQRVYLYLVFLLRFLYILPPTFVWNIR